MIRQSERLCALQLFVLSMMQKRHMLSLNSVSQGDEAVIRTVT